MPPHKKIWQVGLPISSEAEVDLHGYPPVLRQILYNRGYSTRKAASHFLEALPPHGTDPYGILDISEAAHRIEQAIRHNEPIAVYGDYDADGVTATALLLQVLEALNAKVIGYIPNRFDEGYGVNKEALDKLQSEGVKLVITVDCGIRSFEEAEYAKEIGLDLIISDHHHPSRDLPDAIAIINPRRPDDAYPEKDLAGVGLAYKLAHVLISNLQKQLPINIGKLNSNNFLDLVALGTVADLVPLVGENRSLVRAGLEEIRQMRRQGLHSLIMVSGLQAKQLTSTDIGYILGPRLNAAGRLDSAQAALNLLITNDINEAGQLAQTLDDQNKKRQKLTRETQALAEQIALADKTDPLLLFAVHPDFNPGIVGLTASKLVDIYYRPAIVAQQGDVFTRGSCRSISEFHITEALDQCADLLEHHGGHAAAAGFTVRNEYLPDLIERLNSIVEQNLGALELLPTLFADVEINLTQLKPELLDYLEWLQPIGYGNPPATFVSRQLLIKNSHLVGKDGAHLKLSVTDGWITFDTIAFNQGYWQDYLPREIDLLYTFEKNEWNGRPNLQLNVKDIKPSGH